MSFIQDLQWRGLLHDIMPGTEELLQSEVTKAYIGFDPTADSLHIGNLVPVILLKRFQMAGHKPIALVGGATGMVGDPSGKSAERNFLDEDTLNHNLACQKAQLQKFLDFNDSPNGAEIVNNYDWFKNISFLEFIREAGKHITINYMMAKDSVKKRLEGENGMSFTEFTYQLVQGYDFYHLYKTMGVKLQMGGSDQWGNIVTGTELIRRKAGGEAYALTAPLLTKSDGSKFGKSEKGNIWIDPAKTSPYQFYQFWLNVADDDAERFIKIFTFLSQKEIEDLITEHRQQPHMRLLQKKLAAEITIWIHSEAEWKKAVDASEILFGKGTAEQLKSLSDKDILDVFEGVPHFEVKGESLTPETTVLQLISELAPVFPSKGEARRMLQSAGVQLNKTVTTENYVVTSADLLNNRFILISKGKKNYNLIKLV
jgi:tyrosyl-tRNA synthetase